MPTASKKQTGASMLMLAPVFVSLGSPAKPEGSHDHAAAIKLT
jgi:hypothetical protein